MKRALPLLMLFGFLACETDPVDPGSSGVTTINLSSAASFSLVGDSVAFTARVIDGNAQTVQNPALTWSSSNTAVATVGANGMVTGRAVGTTVITVQSGQAQATLGFEVDANPCTAPTAFAVGEVRRYRGATALGCLTLPAVPTAQDFAYIVGNVQTKQDDTLNYAFSVAGVSADAAVASRYGLTDPRDIVAAQGLNVRDQLEWRLRTFERTVVNDALPVLQARLGSRGGAPAAALSVQAALMDVGDTVSLRVPNLNPGKGICKDFIPIRAVVRTLSRKATILEDVTSPPGKLSTTDYNDIAKEFDDVIFPADTLWFGAPTDLNNDQRVSIVYTPEVNKLTPPGSNGIVGGFFFGGDLLRRNEYPTSNDCRNQTNEQEIFYLLAPDPQATINGNARTTAGVRQVTRGTIAHEFQHMINQSVRQYNPATKAFETPWLNEGLAHFAEEVVGRAVSGFGDFQSLRTTDINPSATNQNDFLAYYRQNLTRFRLWTLRPDTSSPTSERARDQLASRGAAWALVRYAADQYANGNARAFFRKLAAGPETDIANLMLRTGRPFDEIIGGWLVANFAEDRVIPGLNARYTYASWDMSDVLKSVNNNTYPLLINQMPGTYSSMSFSGSGQYYQHRRAAGSGALTLNLRTTTGAPITSPNARVWVMRTG
jgi:hypothetical protein